MAKKKVIEPEEISNEEVIEEVETKEEVIPVVVENTTEVVIQNKAWRIKMGLQEE